jgi:ribonuclease P protein component
LEPHIGIGFTATRKVGGAVVRNRCKRRLRETARLLVPLHGQSGFDYVFIARAATAEKEWARLMGDVKSALVSLAEDGAPGNDAKQA